MNNLQQQHPGLSRLRSTTQLLRQTTSTFASRPLTFFFLSILLFSFRSFVDHCSFLLTSFIDQDPSLNSLLSRLPLHNSPARNHHPTRQHPYRRTPFLHLTRVGTIDDDFFSTEEDDPYRRSLYGSRFPSPVNGTVVALSGFGAASGLSRPIVDNGLILRQIVRPNFSFRHPNVADEREDEGRKEYETPETDRENDDYHGEKSEKELGRIVDLRLFIRGLEIGRRDAVALFFLVSFLSAAYGWVILGFTAVYSVVLGVVFVTVIGDLIGRFSSFVGVGWNGSRLGLKKATGFILMRWAVSDALTQLLGLWYFGEIEDQFSFFRLFVRLKLMPFTVSSPWIRGFEKEISGFLFTWFLLDAILGLILAVDAYVSMVDPRRTGREIVKEGCYLISLMLHQATQIKCLEAVLCGSFVRWLLAFAFGKLAAMIFQSVIEVYFMVAWLIFYLSARCKDAHLEGRRFGRRDLEALLDGVR